MQKPALPANEQIRLSELRQLALLHTEPDPNYDTITRLAAAICEVPIALVSLIDADKQWFKAKIGWDLCDTARDISFCAHAILQPREITIIPDSRLDERFKGNPLLTSDYPVIFYAGVPLLSKTGNPIGTLCIIDHKPRNLSEAQISALKDLAVQVENLFELRRSNLQLQEVE
ncbi:MAG: GAF domain-containing protein, partial [Bacteroidota bacterium]|nr:GAF domain-containing protein [Bacteroidota bacterium]